MESTGASTERICLSKIQMAISKKSRNTTLPRSLRSIARVLPDSVSAWIMDKLLHLMHCLQRDLRRIDLGNSLVVQNDAIVGIGRDNFGAGSQ